MLEIGCYLKYVHLYGFLPPILNDNRGHLLSPHNSKEMIV